MCESCNYSIDLYNIFYLEITHLCKVKILSQFKINKIEKQNQQYQGDALSVATQC